MMLGILFQESSKSHQIVQDNRQAITAIMANWWQIGVRHSTFSSTLALLAFSTICFSMLGCNTLVQQQSLETRAQNINRSLVCPICPGETLDQSQIELAKQMKAIILEKLAAGDSPDEIRTYFVERYGPRVLSAPPKKGLHLIAWIVPPIAILGGILSLFFIVRAMQKNPANNSGSAKRVQNKDELKPYLDLIDKEI